MVKAKLIREIGPEGISEELWKAAGGSKTGLGTGGMVTKLRAAELARQSGGCDEHCTGQCGSHNIAHSQLSKQWNNHLPNQQ